MGDGNGVNAFSKRRNYSCAVEKRLFTLCLTIARHLAKAVKYLAPRLKTEIKNYLLLAIVESIHVCERGRMMTLSWLAFWQCNWPSYYKYSQILQISNKKTNFNQYFEPYALSKKRMQVNKNYLFSLRTWEFFEKFTFFSWQASCIDVKCSLL